MRKLLLAVCSFLLVLAIVASPKGDSTSKADSLEKLLKAANDSQRIELLIELSVIYQRNNPEKSLNYLNQAQLHAEKVNNLEGKAKVQMAFGEYFIAKSNYKDAFHSFNDALKLYETIGNYQKIGEAHLNIATIYNRLGIFDQAVSSAGKALVIFDNQKDIQNLGKVYNLLGIIYDNTAQYPKSISYYLKSLEAFSVLNNEQAVTNTYLNLSIVYYKTGRINDALQIMNKSIERAKEYKDDRLLSISYNNMALLYSNSKDYQLALEYNLKAIEIKKRLGDQRSIMISLINLAETYVQLDQPDVAYKNATEALQIGKQLHARLEMKDAYNVIAKIHAEKGRFKEAYQAKEAYSLLVDSLFGEEQKQKIAMAQEKFELQKLESENTLLRQNNVISELKLEKTVFTRNFLIIGLLLTIILISLMIFQGIMKRKANTKLIDLNQQLVKLNTRLSENELALKETNASKDQFFSIISHDLRNPLASMISFVRILRRDHDSLTPEEWESLVNEFDKTVTRTSNLLENLLMWSRSQTGRVVFKPEKICINSIMNDCIDLYKTSASNKNITISTEMPSRIFVNADVNMLETIFRNLVSNAMKFTPAEGIIQLGFTDNEKMITVYVKDSGIGMPKEIKDKLFTLGSHVSRIGTDNEKGSGLGLLLVKDFVEKHGGRIWVESQQALGTTFFFTLPKA